MLADKPATINNQTLLVILAQSFLKLGDLRNAGHYYRAAGALAGENSTDYLLIAGNLLLRAGMVEDALDAARKALGAEPTSPRTMDLYHRVLRETCLFDEIERQNARLLQRLLARDPAALAAENPLGNISWCANEAVNASLTSPAIAVPVTEAIKARRRARPHRWGDRIRIGYLSDDFYDEHPVLRLMHGVLTGHDPVAFDVTCFCWTSKDNIALDSGGRKLYPKIVPIGHLSDADAAKVITDRDLDIAVDLKGHTRGMRPNLINMGLAPLQVAWLGYPGSGVGIDCDYVISDRIVTPDSAIPFYHEKFCRMPESYQSNDDSTRPPPVKMTRQALGLPENRLIFGFFNAARKITPLTFQLTMEILSRTGDSLLWILFFNDFAEANFRAAANQAGIAPDRIISAPKSGYAAHIARLSAVDIGLDSFPYNGHTTTSDMLWAGTPVITYRGSHFASRVSESLLTALGLADLVAEDPAAYVDLAVKLANDTAKIEWLRSLIAQNRLSAPLFDTSRFTHHLETAYRMMTARAQIGLPPDHFDVPAS